MNSFDSLEFKGLEQDSEISYGFSWLAYAKCFECQETISESKDFLLFINALNDARCWNSRKKKMSDHKHN